MSCAFTITNGDKTITVDVVVDSGCQEELLLEARDIESLGLTDVVRQEDVIMPDNSICSTNIYKAVSVVLTLSDGTTAAASVTPCCFAKSTEAVEGVPTAMRLAGYTTMMVLGLKLDFKAHKLVRRVGIRI
jgi:hypothetical protein